MTFCSDTPTHNYLGADPHALVWHGLGTGMKKVVASWTHGYGLYIKVLWYRVEVLQVLNGILVLRACDGLGIYLQYTCNVLAIKPWTCV